MKKTKPTGRILDMTQGKPLKLLLTFALPLFLGNILQQFYNLADTSLSLIHISEPTRQAFASRMPSSA